MSENNTRRQRGATMVEYAIVAALIATTAIAAATVLGSRVNFIFCRLPDLLVTRQQDPGGGEGEGGESPCY